MIISLNWHITWHTTSNIIFGIPCVHSSLLKLEILHPNRRGTPNYTISQRLIHNYTYNRLFLQITLVKQFNIDILSKESRSKKYWDTKWRNDSPNKVRQSSRMQDFKLQLPRLYIG